MTKTGSPTPRTIDATAQPPVGARFRTLLDEALTRARRSFRAMVPDAAARSKCSAWKRTVTIEGYYEHQAMSMRLDRNDVRHYAGLAQKLGLEPSLAGYLDFRIRTAELLLPSPLELRVAGARQSLAGRRADRFLFAEPTRAEQDFLQMLD